MTASATLPGYRVVDAAPSVARGRGCATTSRLRRPDRPRPAGRRRCGSTGGSAYAAHLRRRALGHRAAGRGGVLRQRRPGRLGGARRPRRAAGSGSGDAGRAGRDRTPTGPARSDLPGHGAAARGDQPRDVGRRHGGDADATARSALRGAAGARRGGRGAGQPTVRRAGLAADELAGAVAGDRTWSRPPSPARPAPRRPDRQPRTRVADLAADAARRGGPDRGRRRAADAAIAAQAEVEEVALVCVPGLADLLDARRTRRAARGPRRHAAPQAQDRLGVVSAAAADAAAPRRAGRHGSTRPSPTRPAGAPWPPTPRGCGPPTSPATGLDRYPPTDPVGHVCGVIARLDRERGSGWSPANALVADAVDTADPLPDRAAGARPRPAASTWSAAGSAAGWRSGARAPSTPATARYLAHRRLVHRIVRAVRRVAEPLVFDTNDRLLWFARRAGRERGADGGVPQRALRGETPDQAYRVRCDETTNPPEDRRRRPGGVRGRGRARRRRWSSSRSG